jgi:hypothetical protein
MVKNKPEYLWLQIRELLKNKWGSIQSFFKDRPDHYAMAFIDHNRKIWRGYRLDQSQGEILIEANNIGSCNVAFSYVGSYLGRKEKSMLIVYTKGLSKLNMAVYSSFVDSFLYYSSKPYHNKIESLYSTIFPKINTKRDLEDLCVDGIWIGDLIYDEYIRRLNTTTVDLSSRELAYLLRKALGYLLYWDEYFRCHRVKAVLISHSVFTWAGIITRVAVKRSIPVYLAQPNRIYCVTNTHNSRAFNEYIDYPKRFTQLSYEEQSKARSDAKQRLERRFNGERDVGMHHLLKPTYKAKTGQKVLAENPLIKVLVASHCFSDDNHVYGNNLFPDFYEWLLFLGNISERTNYDWYIKLHPDRYAWETQHIEEFARSFPRFKILPSDTSHHQIIEDGITCVLTVYGTIGFEYAALGVPVITASLWNPTVAYDFNLHPKTVDEYERILMNLGGLKLNIDINKVYEYYYCHYIDDTDDWLYDSFDQLDADIGGGRAHIGSLSYQKFMDQFSMEKHKRILETVERFIRSRDYCLRRMHIADSSGQ